jgi:hypothetical protein
MSAFWRGPGERVQGVMDATREIEDLWTTLFGEPPFIRAEPSILTEVLVASLPAAPPYEIGETPEDAPA